MPYVAPKVITIDPKALPATDDVIQLPAASKPLGLPAPGETVGSTPAKKFYPNAKIIRDNEASLLGYKKLSRAYLEEIIANPATEQNRKIAARNVLRKKFQ